MTDTTMRNAPDVSSVLRGYFSRSLFSYIPGYQPFFHADGGFEIETIEDKKKWSGMVGLGFSYLSATRENKSYISRLVHFDVGMRARFWGHAYADLKFGAGPSLYSYSIKKEVGDGIGLNLFNQLGAGFGYCVRGLGGCMSVGLGTVMEFGTIGPSFGSTAFMVNIGIWGTGGDDKRPVDSPPKDQSLSEDVTACKDDGALENMKSRLEECKGQKEAVMDAYNKVRAANQDRDAVFDEYKDRAQQTAADNSKLIEKMKVLENLRRFVTVVPPMDANYWGKANPVLDTVIRRVGDWVYHTAMISNGKLPYYKFELEVRGFANDKRDEKKDTDIADERADYVIAYLTGSKWTVDGLGRKITPMGKMPSVGGTPILTIRKQDATEPLSKEAHLIVFGGGDWSNYHSNQIKELKLSALNDPNNRMTIIQCRVKKLGEDGNYHEIPAHEFLGE